MSWVGTGGNFIAINGIDVPILKDKLIILFFDDQNLDGVVRVTNASLYIYMLTMSCIFVQYIGENGKSVFTWCIQPSLHFAGITGGLEPKDKIITGKGTFTNY